MLLKNKNAVIYGAGGSLGGAVARAFATEGANIFLWNGYGLIMFPENRKRILQAERNQQYDR